MDGELLVAGTGNARLELHTGPGIIFGQLHFIQTWIDVPHICQCFNPPHPLLNGKRLMVLDLNRAYLAKRTFGISMGKGDTLGLVIESIGESALNIVVGFELGEH